METESETLPDPVGYALGRRDDGWQLIVQVTPTDLEDDTRDAVEQLNVVRDHVVHLGIWITDDGDLDLVRVAVQLAAQGVIRQNVTSGELDPFGQLVDQRGYSKIGRPTATPANRGAVSAWLPTDEA